MFVTKGYGWTVDDINKSCPAELKPYERAKQLEFDRKDEEMWAQGLYNYNAMSTALANFGSGLSGKTGRAEYLEKPIKEIHKERMLNEQQTREEYKYMTEEEKKQAELEKAMAYFNSFDTRFNASKKG